MKNLKDDNFTDQKEAAELFKDLPTCREADELESSLAEQTSVEFSAKRMTERTISKLHDEMAAETPKRARRRRFRAVLIAACAAVLLVGTAFAAKEIIHNKRLNEMLGITEDAGELENAFFEIGISKKVADSDLTITVVDSIGDSHSQWIEVKTNKKFEVPVEDGWLPKNFDSKKMPANIANVFSLEYSLENEENLTYQTYVIPFCRDGYLWYMVWATAGDPINNADVLLKCGSNLEFRWKNNYEADEKTIVINKTIGKYTYTKVVLSPSRLVLYAEKNSEYPTSDVTEGVKFQSITLSDGTVLPLKKDRGDGPLESGGSENGKSYRELYYMLLPNHTFETPASITSVIPKDDIVAVTVNGVTIPLK